VTHDPKVEQELEKLFLMIHMVYVFSLTNYYLFLYETNKLIIMYVKYEGCYYLSLGVRAHEPRILYTYIIGVYIIETFYNYNVHML